MLSIIIPTYNLEKTLPECLESIVSQSYKKLEVLVIDGNSTDCTIGIAKHFRSNYPFITILSEKDNGIYDAMNKGIRMAQGEWLYFIGSDDILFDSEVLSDVFKEINCRTDRFVYGNVLISGDTGWSKNGQVYDGKFNIEKLLKINISHQAIFYHKDVFKQCGLYNVDYTICSDYDMNLRVASKFDLRYIEKIIAKFNAYGSSTNVQDSVFNRTFAENILKYYRYKLYKNAFKGFEPHIVHRAILNFKRLKFLQGLYFLSIGMYFKMKRILLND